MADQEGNADESPVWQKTVINVAPIVAVSGMLVLELGAPHKSSLSMHLIMSLV